ncbi:MAG: transposase [Nitrospirae bacterium]|nr:transposase [Nitrospirota bacterium]
MARPLRIEYAGAVYHITSRGNERKPVFKSDQDRLSFLNTLQHVNKRYNWICHAYCLMDNHYHLLIETPDGNLSVGMRQLNGVYTQLFNKQHGRAGHLFQGRYKSILIQKDSHLLEVCRYVVLNPVRARMVETPDAWKWSSYKATAGRESPHPCLTSNWVLGQFSGKKGTAEKEYRQFVQWGIGKAIWTEVRGQAILGEEAFGDTLVDHLRKHKDIPEIPKSQRYANRPALEKLFTEKITRDKQRRDKKIAEAVEKHLYSQREIAAHLGLHYTSVSRIIHERD